MRRSWMLPLALAAGLPACTAPATKVTPAFLKEVKARIREVPSSELAAWTRDGRPLVLIDVREKEAWQAGHAVGALHIPRWTLPDYIGAAVPDKSACIVLYCQGGVRSAMAADKLQHLGYRQVYSLAGGFQAYLQAGLPKVQ